MLKSFVLFLFLSFLISCEPGGDNASQGSNGGAEVLNSGLANAVNFKVIGGEDRGEIVVGSDEHQIEIQVSNNSKFEVSELKLLIDEDSEMSAHFYASGGGIGTTPGFGGSCQSTLDFGQSCSFIIAFNPNRAGEFTQNIKIEYKTLIDLENTSFTLKSKTGAEASLVFSDDTSYRQYGIFERSEPLMRVQDLTIINKGGLTARDIKFSLTGNTNPSAFNIVDHNCPSRLEVNESCNASVSYIGLNYNAFDSDQDYSASLVVNYEADANSSLRGLNSTFLFSSYEIKGRFTSNTSTIEFVDDVISGNKATKSFKITNTGYREGIIKRFDFYKPNGDLWAKCTKSGSTYLNCLDPIDNVLSLADFPFQVEDIGSCIDAETAGADLAATGDSCYFNLIFWPSISYQEDKDFSGTKIHIIYDSRYKGNEEVLDQELYTVNAKSLMAAKLIISKYVYNNTNYANEGSDTVAFFDLKRLALITNATYKRSAVITIKNIGSSTATFTSLQDGKGNNINGILNDISTYYLNVITDCGVLGPNETCEIKFDLAPLSYSDSSVENDLMFDENPAFIADPKERYKRFIVSYTNESMFLDDGSPAVAVSSEARISTVLIQKGFLVYSNIEPNQGDVGRIYGGDTKTFKVLLENVGTGSIPYIKIDDTYNLSNSYGFNVYPFEIIPDAPGPQADLDCYDIVDFNNSELGGSPDPSNQLPAGDTCALTVQYKLNEANREPLSNFINDYLISAPLSTWGTSEAWSYLDYASSPQYLSFHYYDGDISDPNLDLVSYGNYFSLDNFVIDANFRQPAEIIPIDPTPITSAIIYRPSFSLAAITDGSQSVGADTAPAIWINQGMEGTDFSPIVRSDNSINHVNSFVNSSYDYTLHAGSFIADGSSYKIEFSLYNSQTGTAQIQDIYLTDASGKFTLLSGGAVLSDNAVVGYDSVRRISLNYLPTLTESNESVLTIVYYDQLETVSKNIRIIAEGIHPNLDPADIEVRVENFDVSYDGSSVSETLSSSQNLINTKLNNYDSNELIHFEAIRNSPVYAKKRFYIKNKSLVDSVEGVKVNVLETLASLSALNSGYSYSFENLNNCDDAILPPGAECYFDIKFEATDALPDNMLRFLTISYKLIEDQFVYKSIEMQFDSLDPADLSIASTNSEQVEDSEGYYQTSFPIELKYFNQSGHIVATTYPTSKTVTKTIENASTLKASFLSMISGAVTSGAWIEIYNQNNTQIMASRACLYGDDEFDSGIPDDEKGFNVNSVSTCQISLTYNANETYLGQEIDVTQNVIPLEFYNNKRNSTDYIRIHLKGFIEPNWSTSNLSSYEMVEVSEDGDVYFEFGNITENAPVWGSIVGFRVFYSEFQDQLVNIHDSSAFSVDLGLYDTSFSISGLAPGKYYYFKVAAIRNKNGKLYNSETNLGMLRVVVPPSGMIYFHDGNALIDRDKPDYVGNREQQISECASYVTSLSKNGSVVNKNRSLVNSNIIEYLYSDPDQNSFSTYSDYDLSIFPTHLSDNAADIAVIWNPYGFDSSIMNDEVDVGYKIIYRKSCDTSACNYLYKLKGGQGIIAPRSATLYYEEPIAGFGRCYTNI